VERSRKLLNQIGRACLERFDSLPELIERGRWAPARSDRCPRPSPSTVNGAADLCPRGGLRRSRLAASATGLGRRVSSAWAPVPYLLDHPALCAMGSTRPASEMAPESASDTTDAAAAPNLPFSGSSWCFQQLPTRAPAWMAVDTGHPLHRQRLPGDTRCATSQNLIYVWRHRRQGSPSFRMGHGGRVMYRRDLLDAWLSEQQRADSRSNPALDPLNRARRQRERRRAV
jgi:hypothetical protein